MLSTEKPTPATSAWRSNSGCSHFSCNMGPTPTQTDLHCTVAGSPHSAFAMVVLAFFRSISGMGMLDAELYAQTLRDFLRAGGNLDDVLDVRPFIAILNRSDCVLQSTERNFYSRMRDPSLHNQGRIPTPSHRRARAGSLKIHHQQALDHHQGTGRRRGPVRTEILGISNGSDHKPHKTPDRSQLTCDCLGARGKLQDRCITEETGKQQQAI